MSIRDGNGRLVLLGAVIAAIAVVALLVVAAGDDDDGLSTVREEAADGDAKASVRSAQTAIETYATDNNGSYLGATPAVLREIEPTLPDSVAVDAAGLANYTLTVPSPSGASFTIIREPPGTVTHVCSPPGEGTCPDSGQW